MQIVLVSFFALSAFAQTPLHTPPVPININHCSFELKASVMYQTQCARTQHKPKTTNKTLPNFFQGNQSQDNFAVGGSVILDKSEKNKRKPPQEKLKGAEIEFNIKTQ